MADEITLVERAGSVSRTQFDAALGLVEKTADLGKPDHPTAHVSSYAALRALQPTTDGTMVYLSATPAEGWFRYDATDSTGTDDGGRIIVSTTGGKRWKRLLSSGTEVRPEWWGGKPDDSTNCTAAFVAAIASLGQKGGTVRLSSGTYRVDGGSIVLPALVTIEGPGGFSRFNSTYGNVLAASRICRRLAVDIGDLVVCAGSGSGLRNVHLEGRTDSAGTVLVMQGFESVLDEVRIIASAGIGLDIQKANNVRWRDIYVDNCGSSSLPAVKMWAKDGVGEAADTNTVFIYGLTIERPANRALEIGVGGTSTLAEYRAEFVTIYGLHIEPGASGSSVSMVKVGNVRHLDFVSPFIFGGTSYCIEHDQNASHPYGSGGIRVIGGTLLGTGSDIGSTAALVKLRNGNDISFEGVKFARYSSTAIVADVAYGSKVAIAPTCSFDGPGTDFTDSRTQGSQLIHRGRLRVEGRISAAGGTPTFAYTSGVTGTSVLGGSNDVCGQVNFGTSASPPAAGVLVTVTFNRAYTNQPIVMLTPATGQAQALGLWVATSNTGFTIRCTGTPGASVAAGTYQVQYHVLGTGD